MKMDKEKRKKINKEEEEARVKVLGPIAERVMYIDFMLEDMKARIIKRVKVNQSE